MESGTLLTRRKVLQTFLTPLFVMGNNTKAQEKPSDGETVMYGFVLGAEVSGAVKYWLPEKATNQNCIFLAEIGGFASTAYEMLINDILADAKSLRIERANIPKLIFYKETNQKNYLYINPALMQSIIVFQQDLTSALLKHPKNLLALKSIVTKLR